MRTLRTILALAALIAAGAVRADPPFLPASASGLRSLVLQRTPVGTPIADAKESAESLGFSCTWIEHTPFYGMLEPADYFYCDRVDAAKRWQLALISRDGKLQAVQALYGAVDSQPARPRQF